MSMRPSCDTTQISYHWLYIISFEFSKCGWWNPPFAFPSNFSWAETPVVPSTPNHPARHRVGEPVPVNQRFHSNWWHEKTNNPILSSYFSNRPGNIRSILKNWPHQHGTMGRPKWFTLPQQWLIRGEPSPRDHHLMGAMQKPSPNGSGLWPWGLALGQTPQKNKVQTLTIKKSYSCMVSDHHNPHCRYLRSKTKPMFFMEKWGWWDE